jgi:hypothetical protein
MAARISLAVAAALLAFAPAAHGADSHYEGISADGAIAFFSTTDKLVPGDTDTRRDVYVRTYDEEIGGYVTRQVSFGPTGGNDAFDVQYLGAGEDGLEVFFSTRERLTVTDKDTATDIYVRDLEENKTTLVSQGDPSCAGEGCGSAGANGDVSAVSGGIAGDGNTVFFASAERLATGDQDSTVDVYVRDIAAGTTTRVSAGDPSCLGPGCGNGSQPAFFLGMSGDGSKAVFTTHEALVNADGDGVDDLYERDIAGGMTKLVSVPGECPLGLTAIDCAPIYGGVSSNASHVFFESKERITGGDTDSSQDVYEWSAGSVVLASQSETGGNGLPNALYAGSSPDGEATFFETKESLVAADTDSAQDVYERSAGTTTLVSRRAASCEPAGCGDANLDAAVVRTNGVPSSVFDEGAKVFFFTDEKLTAADKDESFDSYVRDVESGATTLVSQADPSCLTPGCGSGPHNANFAGASADGSHAFFVTEESLVPADTDGHTDVYDRNGGSTTLISTGSVNGNGPYDAQLQGAAADGSRAFFVTDEHLTDEDDFAGQEDVYVRSASGTLLVSTGNDAELESKLAPPPPDLERTDPESPGVSTKPMVIGAEPEAAAAIKLYTTADCSGEPAAIGSGEDLALAGIAVTVAPGSTTSIRGTAEAEGFISACSEPLTYTQKSSSPPPPLPSGGGGNGPASPPATPAPVKTHDGVAYVTPATRITFGPAFKTRVPRPTFRFTDSTGQPDTRFICRLDKGRWAPCGSPKRLKQLARGTHVFSVKAVNAVGAWEAKPAKRKFKLVSSR